jgi:hypothetical protein
MLGAAAVSVAAVAVIALMLWNRSSTPPQISATNSQTASPTRTTVENRLALATASFDARNYRSAAAYAAEVLAIDPNHAAAQKIRGESQAMLAKFDDAVEDARKRIAAGDLSGGARALDAARALDPTAPVLIELTARLNELVRRVDANARAAADRAGDRVPARAEPPPPPAKSTGTAKPASPTTPATPGSQAASPATGSQPPANPPATTAPAPVPVQPPAAEAPVVPKPLPTPPSAPEPRPAEPKADAKPAPSTAAPAGPTAEQDEAAIRRLAASYARAIETKDIGLFRSIKPNLSRAEERRLQDGFRAVTSQRVNLTVVSVDRRGDRGVMVIRRRDTIQAGGREQTVESQQTLTVARESGSWVIVDIK